MAIVGCFVEVVGHVSYNNVKIEKGTWMEILDVDNTGSILLRYNDSQMVLDVESYDGLKLVH